MGGSCSRITCSEKYIQDFSRQTLAQETILKTSRFRYGPNTLNCHSHKWLTTWNIVLQKLIVAQLAKKFHARYSTRRSITVFTRVVTESPAFYMSCLRGPFEKFMDSHYYSESELGGGAVTVSFSKYLPWQAMHFLQRSTHFLKTWCRLLITSNFLASVLPLAGIAQKSHGVRSELNSVFGLEKVDRWNPIRISAIQSISRRMWFLGFSSHKKGATRQEISKWSTVCSTFSRSGWGVVRSASLVKGGTWKKSPSPHLHKVPTRSNKVSPWTLKMGFVTEFDTL
jgi:hypothetical protein